MTIEDIFTLHDDASTREKLKVMTKWDVMIDDARNPNVDWEEQIESVLEVGKKYRVTIIVEEEQ